MLEIMFIMLVLIGGLWGGVCLMEHNHKLRMREIDKFMKYYKKLHVEAERQRTATEMASAIMLLEREYRKRK